MDKKTNNMKIKGIFEIDRVEALTSKNNKKYIKISAKHYKDEDKKSSVFFNLFDFKDSLGIEGNYGKLDEVVVTGDFNISSYKSEKDNTYKNSYNIYLSTIQHTPTGKRWVAGAEVSELDEDFDF